MLEKLGGLVLALGLIACSAGAQSAEDNAKSLVPKATPTVPITSEQMPADAYTSNVFDYDLGDTSTLPDYTSITLLKYDPNPPAPIHDPNLGNYIKGADPGYKLVAAKFRRCAGPHPPGGTLTFDGTVFDNRLFSIRTTDGRKGKPMLTETTVPRRPEWTGDVMFAGECVSGWAIFEIPKGTSTKYIIWEDEPDTLGDEPMYVRWNVTR